MQTAHFLHVYLQSVIGQLHASGQLFVHFFIKAHLMIHVYKIGSLGPDPLGKRHGFIHRHVRMVLRLVHQRVHNERVDTFKIGIIGLIDGLHVGDIGKVTKPIAQDGQLVMNHLDRQHLDIPNGQGLMGEDRG